METDKISGISVEPVNAEPAPIERHPECPLPAHLDGFLARALVNSGMTIALQDPEFRYVFLANRHPSFNGQPLLGKRQQDLSAQAPAAGTDLLAISRRVLDSGEPAAVEGWFTGHDNADYFIRLEVDRFPFPDGKNGLLNRLIDLTKSRRAPAPGTTSKEEEANSLLESTSYMNTIMRSAMEQEGSIYNLVDDQMRYVWSMNYEIMGFTHEQTVGKSLLETPGLPRAEAEYAYNLMKSVLDTGIPFESEGWFEVRPGVRRYSKFQYQPMQLPSGKRGVLSIARDLTKEKMAEISMTATNQMLASANLNLETMNRQLDLTVRELEEKTRILNQELEEARALQFSMLPSQNPLPGRFSIAAHMQTSESVGGDYYDFIRIGEDGLALALGDATGHGLRASIIVASVRSYFQMLAREQAPGAMLSTISRGIESMSLDRIFMGFTALAFTGGRFRVATAGMPPLLWYKGASGEVEVIEQRTLFLGTGLVKEYPELELAVAPGDMLVLMSDGYTESRDLEGHFLPSNSLAETVKQFAPKGSQAVVDAVRELQVKWTGGLARVEDDSTILAIRYER